MALKSAVRKTSDSTESVNDMQKLHNDIMMSRGTHTYIYIYMYIIFRQRSAMVIVPSDSTKCPQLTCSKLPEPKAKPETL